MTFTKRGLIRACTLTGAAFAALFVRNIQLMSRADNAAQKVVYSYSRAIEELASSCDNLSAALEKQLYTSSAAMQQSLATELYKEAASAKAALSQLPVAQLNLENTNKFLSQVGNYSLSISQKLIDGQTLSDEEYENMAALYEFSKSLSEDMWQLENSVVSGELSLSEAASVSSEQQPPYVTSGFSDFEENFEGYPSLIYDGPFSDNILEKTPEMTSSAEEVTKEKALARAAMALNVNTTDLSQCESVDGNMPALRFSDENNSVCCEVTKQGGYISYFLRSRVVSGSSLETQKAIECAEEYLDYLGIYSMETTYYEIEGNVMTINFAYSDLDKRIYPDLVKVSVAMDNGEILGYDARGFLVNHKQRTYPENLISKIKAQENVSPRLTVVSSRLAVIPTDNLDEVLCYEFSCKAQTGRNVLVYINAESGSEEQILILIESDSGTLTE